ncbi:MAG: RNA-guided endonuclease TnpB family protein [Burkholderiaceae bacterium]
MRPLQAFKYELMPTGGQQRDMRRFAGSCRFAFNKALALQKERYEQGEKKLGYAGLCRLLTEWRNDPQATSAIGIDMGIARFATLSDGTFYAPLNSFRRYETALRKAQQAMSRKTRFSSNWKKAKARIQRIHSRIGNARRDYLHKATTTISQNHAMVCIEDLRVRSMSRSAAGTADAPGRNVRAKSGLNKSILDQGWFEFRRQLDYKLACNGGILVPVPARNTSRACPCCGHVSAANRQTQAEFACTQCSFEENADVVGAINVLRAGHARLACEVSGAARPPAAGTHRGDSVRLDAGVSAVGVPRL